MDFIIIDPTGGTFHFPVNPEEVLIRREKQYETATILSLGEIDLLQGERVKEIAFSSFFPKVYDPSYCRYLDIPDPQLAMNKLTAMLMKKQPVRLIITDTIINALVHVSAHDSTFKGGEPGDVYFDVTFRTWRNIKVGSVAVVQASSRPDTKPVPKLYIVKAGDTLTAIAKREMGNSAKWRVIYDNNKAVIGRNPDLIRPGQKLVMP
ncbi:LysM peptidoglycan-binding domain-containing protein [Cohnella sp. WQ 127256]|uniref:LysM peptidoglycan-binding domain-containing protein n=1 Tax=Cohnella sp. WQ 127256 TaxID=2938790 RepID=UPI002118AB08|nr:LysM peptidoglycan-binding domain-containing protein [Cohnella sp. WQ 127256]